MKLSFLRLGLFALVLSGATAVVLPAQDMSGLRARMEERLPKIDEMKADGVVGEDNRGFLDARTTLSTGQNRAMVDENHDRSTVYGIIARNSGTSAADVGAARAKKIAETSKPGVWLQKENGEWYRK